MRARTGVALLSLLLLFLWPEMVAGERVKVIYLDGQSEGHLEVLYLYDLPYVSMASLAEAFDGSLYWAPLTRKMVLRLHGRRFQCEGGAAGGSKGERPAVPV